MATEHAIASGAPAARTDWQALARRTWRTRFTGQSALFAFLVVVSVPIILPYFWMVVIAFTARTGGVGSDVLWTACAVIVPAVLVYSLVHMSVASRGLRLATGLVLLGIAATLLVALIGERLHLDNFRFLWRADFVEELRSKATSGAQFPSVWTAFFNSLALAVSQTVIILTVASLAGYYISRFAFRGRNAFLQGLLVLHAFPAMTLIIPIFLMLYWIHLLDTIVGVMLVLAAIELPFYVFVMKGFFDGVPWDIEMSAMTDGATRRQAFRLVVLPQVRVGLIAVAVFAFIRAWE
jgi:inositol-phosphate transport system permease protein